MLFWSYYTCISVTNKFNIHICCVATDSKPAQPHNSTASTSVWDNKWSSGGVGATSTAARQGNFYVYLHLVSWLPTPTL